MVMLMNKFEQNIHNQILDQLFLIENVGIGIEKKGTCLIALAYEYFNMKWDKHGIDLLLQIPQEYFDKHMITEISNDEDFRGLTLAVINFMMNSEYLKNEDPSFSLFLEKMKGSLNVT